jgi:hypothetical protein
LSRDIQKPNDATAKAPDVQSDHAQALSNYANGLAPHTDATAATTASSLPSLQIVDASPSTPPKSDASSPAPSSSMEKPGLLSRIAQGAAGTVEAVATGAYESGAKTYHTAVNAGAAVIDGVGQAYENRDQIAGAIGNGLSNAADAVVSAAQHPGEALTEAGKTSGGTLAAIGGGLEAGGALAADGAVAAGKWVANHKLETTAMVGAAAVEVLSAGTATPILAGLGALGAAGTVHGIFSLGDQLNAHSSDISVIASPEASAQQREQSFNAIANATGGDALGLAGAATGLGAAKLLGAIRGAAPAVEALDATKPVENVTKPVVATTDAGTPADAATKVAPTQPVEVHAPQQPTQPVDAHTPASSSQPTDAQTTPPAGQTGAPAAEARTNTPLPRDYSSATQGDTLNDASKPAPPEVPQQLDASGRPIADGNAERVAEKHPPLSDAEMATQRAAVESDLASHNGANGQTILEQFNNSNLSPAQKDRVLNVLAETRSSYMKPGADGQVNPEQLGSYRHTLGELKAGLESAKTNGLTSAETQDALLAGMLSDSHKAGFSASNGGNFFTHHLDGALAADTILGRQLGDGFTQTDLKAVQQAIMEHQISPPTLMANFYTGELRAGMKRAGVTPTAADEQAIADIHQKIANPLTSAQEPSGQGGARLQYTQQERDLLQKYVGEGAQNWYVPAQTGSEAPVVAGGVDVGKISAVVRTADIDDNYSAETDAAGKAIRGPFKIAGMRGPRENPPDLSLAQATEGLRNNMRQSESLLTDADKARLASPERNAAADSVYEQAKAKVGDWLTQKLGHAPDANTPYWGEPLKAPPAGSAPQVVKEWLDTPDVKLGQEIQQKFAQELYEMRRKP